MSDVPFYDVIFLIDHVSLTFDGVTSFLRIINVKNTCKRLRYSETFGGIFYSTMAESEGYNCFVSDVLHVQSKQISAST